MNQTSMTVPIEQVLRRNYGRVLDSRDSVDEITLSLCYDRLFCELIGMDYSNVDYGLIKTAVSIVRYDGKW